MSIIKQARFSRTSSPRRAGVVGRVRVRGVVQGVDERQQLRFGRTFSPRRASSVGEVQERGIVQRNNVQQQVTAGMGHRA